MNDAQAYVAYPQFRHWYNKLLLSEQLGYVCGPAGIAPKQSNWYVVRPIMNLSGMGVGASKCWIESGNTSLVPPGYFWCSWFDGPQYSITYVWEGYWKPSSCWQGTKDSSNLSYFTRWVKTDVYAPLSVIYDELSTLGRINVEFIGNNIIETHLRTSPDPDYNELIPVWQGNEIIVDTYLSLGYTYITSYDDADTFLPVARLGFLVK